MRVGIGLAAGAGGRVCCGHATRVYLAGNAVLGDPVGANRRRGRREDHQGAAPVSGRARASALFPSLFDRDAYQAYLRKHPGERTALRLAVQWKAGGVDWSQVKLRAELRGVLGDSIETRTLEMPVKKNGLFSNWTDFKIEGEDFKKFGELAAWRVTLWEGEKQIGPQQSFLWSGVGEAK